MKVLHVVESYGGGVATSVSNYVTNTPEIEHHLIAHSRREAVADDSVLERFSSVRALSDSFLKARSEIRNAINEIRPQVVHAHSSFGGAFTRLSIVNRKRHRIVYTPHGYSFERRDISAFARGTFWLLEWLLSMNTFQIAACSPREVSIAPNALKCGTIYVPNVAHIASTVLPRVNEVKEVVALGRITAARSPEFFADFVTALRKLAPDVEVKWIGDGSFAHRTRFESLGVRVSGWLSQSEATHQISGASLMVHPAAWDGFPMAILEAHALGIPIIARNIPALRGAPGLVDSPQQMANLASLVLKNEEVSAGLRAEWARYLSLNTDDEQRSSLLTAYGI